MSFICGVKNMKTGVIQLNTIVVSLILTTSQLVIAQKPLIIIEGGVGLNRIDSKMAHSSGVEIAATPYSTLGLRTPLNKSQNLYLSSDFIFGTRKFDYTFSTPNDYSYKTKRYGFNVGFDYLPTPISRLKNLKIGIGFKLGSNHFKSNLETQSAYLQQILLPTINRNKIELGFVFHAQYALGKKSGIFSRIELRGKETTLLHTPLFFLGYQFKINTYEKQ
jgi:hypothetical protein